MRLYCGIDLHSNNSYLVVLDQDDGVVYRKRLRNDLRLILQELTPFSAELVGIVVESTFNWYWLVDGLIEAGYRANVLSLQNLVHRNTGQRLGVRALRTLVLEELDPLHPDTNRTLAMESTRRVLECIDTEVKQLEQEVLRQLKPDPLLRLLKTVAGVGNVLAPTIRLETGQIDRFASAGKYVSYCRAVRSQRLSNGKSKGQGNRKNGNPYLAWAFVEAAHFAIRYHGSVRRFYERKQARTHRVVALKAVAHKLARASYYVMRDHVPFQIDLAFG